jgi:hypothetical protein
VSAPTECDLPGLDSEVVEVWNWILLAIVVAAFVALLVLAAIRQRRPTGNMTVKEAKKGKSGVPPACFNRGQRVDRSAPSLPAPSVRHRRPKPAMPARPPVAAES